MKFEDSLSLSNALKEIMEELKRFKSNQGVNIRKKNTYYNVGDIVYDSRLPSWARLECVVAGETPNSELQEKGLFLKIKKNLFPGEDGILTTRIINAGKSTEEKVEFKNLSLYHARTTSRNEVMPDDTRSIGEYLAFSQIFSDNLFDDAKISVPIIDLGIEPMDMTTVYLDEDKTLEEMSRELVEDFEFFSEMFGVDLTYIPAQYDKQVLVTISVNCEEHEKRPGDFKGNARTRLDSDKSFTSWVELMDRQMVGRQLEIELGLPSVPVRIKSIVIQVEIRDIEI